MKQNLSAYYTFYTVAQCKSISAASEALYISQPAVSKSISKLEAALNTSLFIRSRKGVVLTPEGEILYNKLSEAFHAIELGEEQIEYESNKVQEHLTIGVSTTLCKYILLPYLKDFVRNNPHVQISIICQSSFETIQALEEGTIDIGLIGEAPLSDQFQFKKTHSINDCFVTSKSYLDHLNIRTGIDYKDSLHFSELLNNSTLILMDKGNLSRVHIDKYIKEQTITPENIIEVSTMDLLIEFSSIGLGVSCVIKQFVEDELKKGALIELPTPFSIPSRNIGFAFPKKKSQNPALKTFLNMDNFVGFYRSSLK